MKLHLGSVRPACIAIACLLLSTGCARRATITLDQPHARPAQQRMKLTSNWAFTGVDGPRRIIQLDFPLPGGVDGPRDFRFFVAVPNSTGWHVVTDGGGARGFFVQAAPGELHGKSLAVGGRVRVRDVLTSPREKRVEIDLQFEDGSRARGTACVIEDDRELRSFRSRYSADIAALRPKAAESELASDEGTETASRRPGGARENGP